MNKLSNFISTAALCALLALAACTSALKKADTLFASAKYEMAIQQYQKLLQANPAKAAELNFKIGECYRLSNRLKLAAPYYKAAQDAGFAGSDALGFYYGYALKANEQYTDAATQFDKFAKTGSDADFLRRAKAEAKHLAAIQDLMKEKSFTTISPCPEINTPAGEFSPVLYQGNLVFSSTRRGERIFETTGTGYSDLYTFTFADTNTCQGTTAPFFPEVFNMDGMHDAEATFDPNGKFVIFARSNAGKKREALRDVHLFISRNENGTWTAPEYLQTVNDSASWNSTPALSTDGRTLYFASNRKGDTYGGTDIFVSRLNANGTWSRPRNAGKLLNTSGDEMFPHVAPDGRLFFASNGHAGLGGLDLFVQDSTIVRYDSLKRPVKELKVRSLGVPINSSYDDFGIAFKHKSAGYFSSNRIGEGAKGDDDIYLFKNDSADIKFVTYYLRGKTFSKDKLESGSEKLPNVSVELKDESGKVVETVQSDSTGSYAFTTPLLMDKNYTLSGKLNGYLSDIEPYSTTGKSVNVKTLPKKFNTIYFERDLTLRRDILAVLRTPGKKLTPRDIPQIQILYEYDSSRITADAGKTLDEFVEFLGDYFKEYPSTVLELGSHTDLRGSDKYNMALSERRARSAVNYVVNKGIPRENIRARGYGETEPVVPKAKKEAQHQQNRRTTIKIVQ